MSSKNPKRTLFWKNCNICLILKPKYISIAGNHPVARFFTADGTMSTMPSNILPAGRFALVLEYFGAPYCGWQTQDGQRSGKVSIQQKLEYALTQIAGAPVQAIVSGRTDAGVHATAQVCHADVPTARPLSAWVRGVNAHLPKDIAVLNAYPVDEGFHARFSAATRHYTYWIENRPQRSGLLSGRVGWHHHWLDAARMHEAALALLGTHDFSSFRAAECQAKTPIRTITEISIVRDGDFICCTLSGNAFLYHMVRNIVGALVWIGTGKKPVTWMVEILHRQNRTLAAPTFSAEGLYFCGADYDKAFNLPSIRRMPQFGLSYMNSAAGSPHNKQVGVK